MRILVVEDHKETAAALKKQFESECYAVDVEHDGERGFYKARTNDYDLILLDSVLPGKKGYDICSGLRQYNMTTPILILSAQSDVEQKIGLLQCGADDYVTKPFSLKELSARMQSVLRRPKQIQSSPLVVDDLVLDRRAYTVKRAGVAIRLTPKEFALLEYLMKNEDKVLSRAMIIEHVWDENADQFSNSVDVHIAGLRKKIDRGAETKLIHTIPGQGYKLSIL